MNLDSKAIRILCYGDSNTWGASPYSEERYPVSVRWTGVLQKNLGNKYWVIEEGLCGRTTDIDDPKELWRNGKKYLIPCIESHNPLDIVILYLGPNDLKGRLGRSVEEIAKSTNELVKIVKKHTAGYAGKEAKIILLSHSLIDISVKGVAEEFPEGENRSSRLGKHLAKVADKNACDFINLAEYIKSSKEDGLHLEPEAHAKIAQLLFDKIKTLNL